SATSSVTPPTAWTEPKRRATPAMRMVGMGRARALALRRAFFSPLRGEDQGEGEAPRSRLAAPGPGGAAAPPLPTSPRGERNGSERVQIEEPIPQRASGVPFRQRAVSPPQQRRSEARLRCAAKLGRASPPRQASPLLAGALALPKTPGSGSRGCLSWR